MKRFAIFVFLLTLARVTLLAHAEAQEVRDCDFKVKAGCVGGSTRVTFANGAVTRVEVDVVWCNRQRGAPGYTCTIDSSRGDGASTWSEDAGATVITDQSSFTDPTKPDRIKVTIGRDVTIDLNETQSFWRCGAGAELPLTIIIPARGRACQAQFRAP
jgi:hypothetical protein